MTVTGDPSSATVLATWRPGVSAVLESKLLRGITTLLIYSIKISGISEDTADLNNLLPFFQRRLQAGKFSCSIIGRSKVSVKLNLTQSDQEHYTRHGKCIVKKILIDLFLHCESFFSHTGSPPIKLNLTQSDQDNYTRYGKCT